MHGARRHGDRLAGPELAAVLAHPDAEGAFDHLEGLGLGPMLVRGRASQSRRQDGLELEDRTSAVIARAGYSDHLARRQA